MCCSDPPEAPDYSALIEGSLENAEIAREIALDQLDWAKEEYSRNQEVVQQVLDVQLPQMKKMAEDYEEDRSRYQEEFVPFEDKLRAIADDYASPERKEREAARAVSDVGQQFDAQRNNALQNLENYGIDPSMTRYGALDLNTRVTEAAVKAGAANQSRQRVEDIGRAMTADVANFGRGLPSQAAQAAGLSATVGYGGVNAQNQTLATGSSATGNPTNWFGQGQAGLQGAGGFMDMGFQNEMASWEAAQASSPMAAIGGIIGMGVSAYTGGMFGEEGGEVPQRQLSTTPGATDTVPAVLAPGEYVVPANVVRAKGTDFFDKMAEKYSPENMPPPPPPGLEGIPMGVT